MTEFIGRDVRSMRDSSSSERTTLLVGCENDRDELADEVEELHGTVESYLGRTTLRVSIRKSEVDELCEKETVISVERDKDDVKLQSTGNFGHRNGSMM